jgi:OmpA-OmpF porin, OOP family
MKTTHRALGATLFSSLYLAMGLTCASAASAQTQLTPQAARISDAAIHADYQSYQALQARIHQLNERGVPVRDYHLSKAQCWLDVSLHEYTRNDRSAFPQEAMSESEKLILALEQKATPLSLDTPLVNGAARLRPDLWQRSAALKQGSGFACAQQQLACAEVELVHAGNEFNQQQWRHAKPYVQIAEELVAEGSAAASACAPAVVAVPAVAAPLPLVVAAVAPVAAAPRPEKRLLALSVSVVFDFDQSTAAHIRAFSRSELEVLLARIKAEGIVVDALRLVGHADRLNRTGDRAYNQKLSQKRVNTLRDLLAAQGLVVSGTVIDASGDTVPVAACKGAFKSTVEIEECLLPNRRVEVELRGHVGG